MSQNEDPIRKHSDLLLQIIKDKTGVELDYSLGSLLYLDKLLEHHFGKGMERIPEEGMEDLRKALRPCRAQVRLWGHQPDVRVVYPRVDYVLSGLPEKEALGLNLIEAQACGTPVMAVNKPPFTETVVHGRTGYLFDDPREKPLRDAIHRAVKRLSGS